MMVGGLVPAFAADDAIHVRTSGAPTATTTTTAATPSQRMLRGGAAG